ncbi:hypothetical protein NXS15_02820 [Mycoplasma sp. CSL7475-4]|uniref:hypothetical protein n=1 Tax=Mycoplasma sp. CSL7475-4 TaxID=2973942 RepID=UPI00216B40D3|nr:hypothetical protein [Mycoplasma sp. CSL7475-4]MCS4537044.1 hypothetical protein [Mycoplasma sp. CSL7475-4]
MKKINVKKSTILWLFIGIFSLVVMVLCAIIIYRITTGIESIKHVRFEESIIGDALAFKAYAIGILAFLSVIFAISVATCYLGFRSWNYSATL